MKADTKSPASQSPDVGSTDMVGVWSPMLTTGDLLISLYPDDTLEIRDGQVVYAHLTKAETQDFLRWIDARDKTPTAES